MKTKNWKMVILTITVVFFCFANFTFAEEYSVFNENITITFNPEPFGNENSYNWIAGNLQVTGSGESSAENPVFVASASSDYFSSADLGKTDPDTFSVYGRLFGNASIGGPGDLSLAIESSSGMLNSIMAERPDAAIYMNSLSSFDIALQNSASPCNEIQEINAAFNIEGNGVGWFDKYDNGITDVTNVGGELTDNIQLETTPAGSGTTTASAIHEMNMIGMSTSGSGAVLAEGSYLRDYCVANSSVNETITSRMTIMTQATQTENGGQFEASIEVNVPPAQ